LVKEKQLGLKFWMAAAIGAIGMGVVIAFVAGFLLGHFTGHHGSGTTTVAAVSSAEAEAAAEEAEVVEVEEAQAEEAAAEEAQAETGEAEAEEAHAEAEEAAGGESALAVGKGIVESTCSTCHTLSEAGATGTVGPNLDELKPSQALVEKQVTNGGGVMPAFGATFSSSEIEAVAEYVSKVAGTGNESLGG
jgi:mono/diheme cytochrome c family protein